MREHWALVPHNPRYMISTHGNVRNVRTNESLLVKPNLDGSLVVSLLDGERPKLHLVRRLVAEAFLDEPLTPMWNTVIHFDGDKNNVRVDNLGWRTRSVAWRYTRQFLEPVPDHWLVPVVNDMTGMSFDTCISAGIYDGVLWHQVYKSTFERIQTIPYGHTYSRL